MSGEAAAVEQGTCGCSAVRRAAAGDDAVAAEKSTAAAKSAARPLPEDMVAFPGELLRGNA
jgi:hypothetical protein